MTTTAEEMAKVANINPTKLRAALRLSDRYLAGIAFYRNQVLGDALYNLAIYGG